LRKTIRLPLRKFHAAFLQEDCLNFNNLRKSHKRKNVKFVISLLALLTSFFCLDKDKICLCALILLRPAVWRTGKWSTSGVIAGTKPERNDRRRAAGGSRPTIRHFADAARDERAFCETEQAWSSGRQG
jgi:hypothetical protein